MVYLIGAYVLMLIFRIALLLIIGDSFTYSFWNLLLAGLSGMTWGAGIYAFVIRGKSIPLSKLSSYKDREDEQESGSTLSR